MTCEQCPASLLCFSGQLQLDDENRAVCLACGQVQHYLEGHGIPPLPDTLRVWVTWFYCERLEQLRANCSGDRFHGVCSECFQKRRLASEATTE